MKKQIDKVAHFHRAFGLNNGHKPAALPSESLVNLRHRLMQEENDEYREAALRGDKVEVADALGDMLYILCGTALSHGMQDVLEEVFDEIHRSNMSKLGPDGQPIYREDGKVLKGSQYFRPKLAPIIEKHSGQKSQ